MEECPVCHKFSVVYDEYYKTWRCLMVDCGWENRFSPSNKFKEKE